MRGRGIEHANHQLSRTDTAHRTATRYASASAQAAWIGSVDMFVITNRKVNDSSTGLDQHNKTPNENGANELRLARATRRRGLRQ